MAQRMHGGFGGQTGGCPRQPEGVLHGGDREMGVRPRRRVGRLTAFPPARGRPRKQEGRMPVGFPPVAQLPQHGARQGDEAILAPFAAAHMQARMFGVRLAQIPQFDADRFAHAQPGMIDQAQHRAIARQFDGLEQRGDLFAGRAPAAGSAAGRCAVPRTPSSLRGADSPRKKARKAHLATFMAEAPNFRTCRSSR